MNSEKDNRNQESKKGRFNVIDAFIIIVILLCIASVVYRMVNTNAYGGSTEMDEYQVSFEIDNIRQSSVDDIKSGDKVRFKSDNVKIGELAEINDPTPAVGEYNDSGEEVLYPEQTAGKYPDTRCRVTGTINVRGRMTDNGFLLEGNRYIAPNGEIEIITEHIEATIRITGIVAK